MTVKCEERYNEALSYAQRTEDSSLQQCLDKLWQWEKNMNAEITLYYDHSPLSFYFEMSDKEGNRVMNGGLLYHGNPDQSGAIQLIRQQGWQIHT